MAQSRLASFVEVAIDQLIAFIVAVIINMAIYGGSVRKAAGATVVFTLVSIVRRYYMRRFFVWLERNGVWADDSETHKVYRVEK